MIEKRRNAGADVWLAWSVHGHLRFEARRIAGHTIARVASMLTILQCDVRTLPHVSQKTLRRVKSSFRSYPSTGHLPRWRAIDPQTPSTRLRLLRSSEIPFLQKHRWSAGRVRCLREAPLHQETPPEVWQEFKIYRRLILCGAVHT